MHQSLAYLRSWTHVVGALILLLLYGASPTAALSGSAYKVAVGDSLIISVYGDSGLSGIFTVSIDGTIGYPLLGNIEVAGKSVDEIGAQISADLLSHIANRSVAVAIKEYAPVFIMGEVKNPGKYEYRPGMIVLELFALGGGLREPTAQMDTSGIQLIAAQQEYEDLSVQLLAQDVKRVRLEAELKNVPFRYTVGEGASVRDAGALQKIIQMESNLYDVRLSVMREEKANLEIQRENYGREIATLEKGEALRDEQFRLLGMDVDASEQLVTRGAASLSALRERKRELLAMNQQLLEAASFLARAEQNKNEVERRILELASKRYNDAATSLQEIELNIVRMRQKMSFSLQTMAEISAAARQVSNLQSTIQTRFTAVRQVAGSYQEVALTEHGRIQAGDVVRVLIVASGITQTPVKSDASPVVTTRFKPAGH